MIGARTRQAGERLHEVLDGKLEGHLRTDEASRALWSTDASIYQREPVGVVVARSEEDVKEALGAARELGLAVTPRGTGTSLAGQATAPGLALDVSEMDEVIEVDHPFVPHGWSVIVTAPAAFRFTYESQPERHRQVAELLSGERIEKADENTLPEILIQLMKDVGAPSGVRELGYDEADIDQLVEGATKQQRLLVGAPREVTEEDLANILRESMENW